VRFGPGLWPGPRRQARWVGRGSGAQGRVPKIVSAKRLEPVRKLGPVRLIERIFDDAGRKGR